MKKLSCRVIFVIFALIAVAVSSFAEPYVRVKPADNQPAETEVYGREIAPFVRLIMEPVTSSEDKPAMLQGLSVQVKNFTEVAPAVNRVVLILDKSKGVSPIEDGRVVAQGFYSGSEYVSLYPLHGQNIFGFKEKTRATLSMIMTDREGYSGRELSPAITGMYLTWVNGSMATVKGYLPISSQVKTISDKPSSSVLEKESPYGTLKYEVPGDSSGNVTFRKIFIYGKRKGLKILAQIDNEEGKEYNCKNNSYITICDFGGEGIVVPNGSTITFTASEQGVFFSGFEPLDVFCEEEEGGRRIFVTPLDLGGKG